VVLSRGLVVGLLGVVGGLYFFFFFFFSYWLPLRYIFCWVLDLRKVALERKTSSGRTSVRKVNTNGGLFLE